MDFDCIIIIIIKFAQNHTILHKHFSEYSIREQDKLQRQQNAAARLITGTQKLTIPQRVQYKLARSVGQMGHHFIMGHTGHGSVTH